MSAVTEGYSTQGSSIQAEIDHPQHSIPFTGFDAGFLLIGSVILLTLGLALRRLTAPEQRGTFPS